jgi:hypothetical protein
MYWRIKKAWFVFFTDRDWDQGYLIDYLILKYTSMGLYFARHGLIIDEERKKQVHECWELRKYLKRYSNAFDIVHAKQQKEFKDKFGWEHKSELIFGEINEKGYGEITFKEIIPEGISEEDKKASKEWWNKTCTSLDEYTYQNTALDKYSSLFVKYIHGLWD